MTNAVNEEEAKKRWCPFARYGAGECAVNRDLQSDHFGSGNKCIASECMAWRKTGSMCRNRRGILVDRDIDGTGQWIDVGYCGLAGAPGALQ